MCLFLSPLPHPSIIHIPDVQLEKNQSDCRFGLTAYQVREAADRKWSCQAREEKSVEVWTENKEKGRGNQMGQEMDR